MGARDRPRAPAAVFLFDDRSQPRRCALRVQMRLELQHLHRRSVPPRLCYHDQVEAMTLAQRVMVMNKGKCRTDWHAGREVYENRPVVFLCDELYRQPGDEPVDGVISASGDRFELLAVCAADFGVFTGIALDNMTLGTARSILR